MRTLVQTIGRSRSSQDRCPEVDAAIQKLRKNYRIGQQILGKCVLGSSEKKTGIRYAAERLHLHPETARKLRQFALAYTKADLDDLCHFCQEYETPFGTTDIFLLVPIKDRRRRLAVQKAAIIGNWGHTCLRRELRRRFGRRPAKRGRKPQRPRDTQDALLQLFELTFHFNRWHQFIVEPETNNAVQLPKAVQEAMDAAIKAMTKLHAATDRAMK